MVIFSFKSQAFPTDQVKGVASRDHLAHHGRKLGH
jgi:hypothetical protein